MSTFALITAVAQATTVAPPEPALNAIASPALPGAQQREALRSSIEVSIPSLDGGRGGELGYERWIPRYRVSLTVTGELRQTATGDYGGMRSGAGVELRYYWRAAAWRSAQPAGSMVGWFVGERVEVAVDALHDRQDNRWLDSTFEIGATTSIGYRIAPWRGLAITPSLGVGSRHELTTNLPDWTRPTISVGLTVGWLF